MFNDWKENGFYEHVLFASREGKLYEMHRAVKAAHDQLPLWRLVRRFHLERQLEILELAGLCYFNGALSAYKEQGVTLTDRNHP